MAFGRVRLTLREVPIRLLNYAPIVKPPAGGIFRTEICLSGEVWQSWLPSEA